MKLSDIIKKFEERIPLAWQEEWDQSGLALGSATREVKKILFSYDVCKEVLAKAIQKKCGLIVSHHPFRMRAGVKISLDDYEGHLIEKAIQNGIALYSAHTNHDASPESLNRKVLTQLGLQNIVSLQPQKKNLLKLAVFIPQEHTQTVMAALFASGVGGIGNYSECSFRTEGVGTFKGNENSSPRFGKKLRREEIMEERLEVILPRELLSTAVSALRAAHPYEEPAFDVYTLENSRRDVGQGAWGVFAKPVALKSLLQQLKKIFRIRSLRLVSNESGRKLVKRVGICTGSGSSLMPAALAASCDVFITGDVKYHQAIEAKRHDLVLVDPGHFYSEVFAVEELMKIFTELFGNKIQCDLYRGLKDPFQIV